MKKETLKESKIKWLSKGSCGPYAMCSGDTFNIVYKNGLGTETEILTESFTETMEIDYAAIFRAENLGDFKVAMGGLVGKKK